MDNNKESRFNKYFLYTSICVFIFVFVLLISAFIAGNTNVFEWDNSVRYCIVLITLSLTALVIGYDEIF